MHFIGLQWQLLGNIRKALGQQLEHSSSFSTSSLFTIICHSAKKDEMQQNMTVITLQVLSVPSSQRSLGTF